MLRHVHKHLHRHGKKEPIDYVVRFFMVATPLFELPQAYTIYHAQSARDVSLITWLFFLFSSIAWLAYGFKQKLTPLIVAYSLYMIIEISIVIGVIMYS
jgi:uncharacterized protein with PQ loop repeat